MRRLPAFAFLWTRQYSSIAPSTLNPGILNVQYAVRGELAIKADEYREKIRARPKDHGLPFSKITTANIGNPQQAGLDQKPITFGRQVH
jgi:alanine transaminase